MCVPHWQNKWRNDFSVNYIGILKYLFQHPYKFQEVLDS